MEGFIDHVNLRIPESGVKECIAFYCETLGFEPVHLDAYRNGERTSFFVKISESALLNIRPKSDFVRPDRKNYDHFCIVQDQDITALKDTLESNGYTILRQGTPLGTQGRAPALYAEDPFGYVLELKESSES